MIKGDIYLRRMNRPARKATLPMMFCLPCHGGFTLILTDDSDQLFKAVLSNVKAKTSNLLKS